MASLIDGYERVSIRDDDQQEAAMMIPKNPSSFTSIRNDSAGPISKPPTKKRDLLFAVLFLIHFGGIILLSLIEQKSLNHSFIMYSNAGSWSSLLMIVTLIGGFIGGVLSFAVMNEDIRTFIMFNSIPFSIIFQVCLGNILLLIQSSYSIVGLLVLGSAFIDSFRIRRSRQNIQVTSALIQLSLDVGQRYGHSLFFACMVIVVLQTMLLLWWGAFFIGILSEMSSTYADYLIVLMAISLYWITQFFHAFISYIVGGCVLWYFLKDEQEDFDASRRVLLYMQCALTTSLGTLCKGALLCPPAQSILVLYIWCLPAGFIEEEDRGRCSCSYSCSCRGRIQSLAKQIADSATNYNRLAFCLASLYGKTLCKAAEMQAAHHPNSIKLCLEDDTGYSLSAVATTIAGFFSIVIGLLADRNEGSSWPLFFLVIFYLSYSGISVVLHTYRSAIDALIVAFSINPEKFAGEHQIIFLRFVRHTESALHT